MRDLNRECDLAAEVEGKLRPEGTIIWPTSGKTGIALTLITASKGCHLILTMVDTESIEKLKLLTRLGVDLVLTPGSEGIKGAKCDATVARNLQQDLMERSPVDNVLHPRRYSEFS